MIKVLNKIIPPLSLYLAKKKSIKEIESKINLKLCNGSTKIGNREMIVLNHYKPIIKIEL